MRDIQCRVHEDLAHELAQETWLKVARSVDTYRLSSPGGVTSWIITIARDAIRDHLRQKNRRVTEVPAVNMLGLDLPSQAATPEEATLLRELQRAVHLALRKLPPLYREVLLLTEFNGVVGGRQAHPQPPRDLGEA